MSFCLLYVCPVTSTFLSRDPGPHGPFPLGQTTLVPSRARLCHGTPDLRARSLWVRLHLSPHVHVSVVEPWTSGPVPFGSNYTCPLTSTSLSWDPGPPDPFPLGQTKGTLRTGCESELGPIPDLKHRSRSGVTDPVRIQTKPPHFS